MIELFSHKQTVRIIGEFGTPSQRNSLWVAFFWPWGEDMGGDRVEIYRQTDPDCRISIPRKRITAATLLDLLANV